MNEDAALELWPDAEASKCTLLVTPSTSDWSCYMFGNTPSGNGMVLMPAEGNVPNWFVRWMMKACFACTWVKAEARNE